MTPWGARKGESMPDNAPVFVKIEEYTETIKSVEFIKDKIAHARGILKRISELKIEEYNQLSKWDASLEAIEKNIEAVDKALAKPESF